MFRAVKLHTYPTTNHPSPLNYLPNHVQPMTHLYPFGLLPNHVQPIGMLIMSTHASDASHGSPTAHRRPRHYWAVRRELPRGGMCEQLQRSRRTDISCLARRLPLFVRCFVSTVRCNAHLGRQGSSVNVRVLTIFHCRPLSFIHTKYMACQCLSCCV
jgi:hypothetical protein